MRAVRLLVSGHVQGVGYRNWMRGQALDLALGGWVRNLRDGQVEAVVQGDEAAVAELVERAHQGPPLARVDQVQVTDADVATPPTFELRPTA